MARSANNKPESVTMETLLEAFDATEFLTQYNVHRSLGRRPTFKRKSFGKLKLVGHQIPAADFIECDFTGAHFIGCNLQGWILQNCKGSPSLEDCDTRFGDWPAKKS